MIRFLERAVPTVPATVLTVLPFTRAAVAASPFRDKNLEGAIRSVLKHEPNVELTDETLQSVYILEATGKNIKDLTGLEKCKNLAQIRLTKNQISDLRPIRDLTNLESLDLPDNAIKVVLASYQPYPPRREAARGSALPLRSPRRRP
ncbi:MAG TPA: hypothetical protein VKF17_03075 [Isosphaeraceae bacterium]|nr:hypothetical protein [Isosphaeraceae bacterium]